jgi:hypothetical protein
MTCILGSIPVPVTTTFPPAGFVGVGVTQDIVIGVAGVGVGVGVEAGGAELGVYSVQEV